MARAQHLRTPTTTTTPRSWRTVTDILLVLRSVAFNRSLQNSVFALRALRRTAPPTRSATRRLTCAFVHDQAGCEDDDDFDEDGDEDGDGDSLNGFIVQDDEEEEEESDDDDDDGEEDDEEDDNLGGLSRPWPC